ncbi:hypothetical protein [Accumulibacter sp.]|uniref:hypothetical protein n=1 Tax=Accumulibacter sp. TaxID=2053492 RepID=UPI00159A6DC2|nr:MAG: hypothetical protein HT579_15205 [Candidatus Accumulibacter similis]
MPHSSTSPALPPGARPRVALPATLHGAVVALCAVVIGTACAPDAWRPDSRYDAFLDRVQDRCGNLEIGGRRIGANLIEGPDSYFLDLTSRYFHRQISPENYAGALAGSFAGDPGSPAISCILSVPRGSDPMPPALMQ